MFILESFMIDFWPSIFADQATSQRMNTNTIEVYYHHVEMVGSTGVLRFLKLSARHDNMTEDIL